jgi:predicted  nucleic acid-binding Zn-ribbon protein
MTTFEMITQWATILSPIIAVGIAIWTYRDNKKSMRKQTEAWRIICRQQINVQLTMLEIELQKNALERCEVNDEIIQLSKEISNLSQNDTANKADIESLRTKMNHLSKQVGLKGNWQWQIINTQFNLLRQSNELKNYDF